MIEDLETKLRTDIQLIYVSKTQDVRIAVIQIIFNSRFENTRTTEMGQRKLAGQVISMRE